jgi:hypothetical protein
MQQVQAALYGIWWLGQIYASVCIWKYFKQQVQVALYVIQWLGKIYASVCAVHIGSDVVQHSVIWTYFMQQVQAALYGIWWLGQIYASVCIWIYFMQHVQAALYCIRGFGHISCSKYMRRCTVFGNYCRSDQYTPIYSTASTCLKRSRIWWFWVFACTENFNISDGQIL